MTKTSDRFARWFGTRVPLVSRGGMALITFFAVLPFSAMLYLRFLLTIFTVNFWLVLLLSLAVGVGVHILILLFQKIRFNNPSTNAEFLNIVSRIHQKVVVSSRTFIWVRQSQEVFIASTYNPLFNAIIVSEPMVDLILKSPESGEVLLAFHLLRLPRTRWYLDLVGSLILFTILTFLSSALLIPLAISVGAAIASESYIAVMMIGSFASIFLIPIVFIFLVKGTFWRHEPAFVGTEEIYGMHPNVAKVQVETGRILNEEEAQTVVWAVRDWEKNKRGARRVGISSLVAIPSWFLGIVPLAIIGYIPFSPYLYAILAYLPYITAAVLAALAYLLLRRWDRNAMGGVFKKTTDYDEPIWMD